MNNNTQKIWKGAGMPFVLKLPLVVTFLFDLQFDLICGDLCLILKWKKTIFVLKASKFIPISILKPSDHKLEKICQGY